VINQWLLDILVCPADRTPLTLADSDLVDRLNRSIADGQLKNNGGETIEGLLDGGLVRRDQTLLYPIIDGIPQLLVEDAIRLSGGTKGPGPGEG
jgi:uncharacterized protein YbaR (Trm112 family)